MGAIVPNGVTIGWGSITGAGAMIPQGTRVPSDSLVLGVRGKVRRQTTDAECEQIRANARFYVERVGE